MTVDQINELYEQSSKITAIGELLNYTTPNDFPIAGDRFYMDLGQILSDTGRRLTKITEENERPRNPDEV